MAAVKGNNSYVSISEANAYLADRLSADAWLGSDDTQRGQALVTATQLLDNLSWSGTAVSDSQSLAFPRNTEYFDPRKGIYVYVSDGTPDRVANATYELALHLLQNPSVLSEASSPQSVTIGDISITGNARMSKVPSRIFDMIRPLLQNSGASLWWRAN